MIETTNRGDWDDPVLSTVHPPVPRKHRLPVPPFPGTHTHRELPFGGQSAATGPRPPPFSATAATAFSPGPPWSGAPKGVVQSRWDE